MEIKIGRSAHSCAACECDFVHESNIQSLIRVVDGVFAREDYCAGCWNEELGDNAYSAWTAQYYDPRVAEQQPEETFSPLRQTFYKAVEKQDRASMSVAYLAAQLLRRQKVFRLIKETKDPDTDAALILFNDRIGNRLIEVGDPSLTHAELEQARVTLMEALTKLEAPDEEPTDGEAIDASDDASDVSDDTEDERIVDDDDDEEYVEDEYDDEDDDDDDFDDDVDDNESEDHASSEETAQVS